MLVVIAIICVLALATGGYFAVARRRQRKIDKRRHEVIVFAPSDEPEGADERR